MTVTEEDVPDVRMCVLNFSLYAYAWICLLGFEVCDTFLQDIPTNMFVKLLSDDQQLVLTGRDIYTHTPKTIHWSYILIYYTLKYWIYKTSEKIRLQSYIYLNEQIFGSAL